jgi:hypothetical protein
MNESYIQFLQPAWVFIMFTVIIRFYSDQNCTENCQKFLAVVSSQEM